MIILIGNQKGGAGKSTITLSLANYLTLEKKCPVLVIDLDYQQSLMQKYDKAKLLENEEPYEVLPATLEGFGSLMNSIADTKNAIILIDLPGKLDDDGLLDVFVLGNLLICPFAYDEFTFVSTVHFALVLKKVSPKMPLVFVPNRIKANAKFEIMEEVNTQLLRLGTLTPMLPDRIDFQRLTTFQTPTLLTPVLSPVLNQIYAEHIHGKY
ncbi:chromosome partitioning protein [Mucilaginibacter yixingensis]|uniref:Chromosome partitioning protein n=1 Tax=Mucilaginibacter yixingensis TaxID=1295612 RepID=A0A2T5J4G0_9SPHI|nr:ParA family protein [Mucilaginibacter yixingensis]PTQ92147.1 chromosome partitioning protein [Mucilaginibacter yixingensis]